MSDNLAGQKVKDTYGRVLQIANANDGADATLRAVRDGKGDATALSLATTHGDVLVQPAGTTTARGARARFGEYINVKDFGAVGDGATDDAAAFQAALDAVPATGGVVYIPPTPGGVYRVDACLRHKSYTTIRGSGAAAVVKNTAAFVADADYLGTAMWLNANSEFTETEFTSYRDFSITFDNVWVDVRDNPAGGAGHSIAHRAVQHVRILNCYVRGGGSGTVSVTCDDHVIDGCRATDQRNCLYDHWGGSTNCALVNSFGRVSDDNPSQAVNFNGIRTGVGGGVSEVWTSDGFTMSNCDIYGNATQRSISLEPLGSSTSFCKNIRIIGNRLYNIRIVGSGGTSNVLIQGNQFIGATNNANIWMRTLNGLDANNITVVGNHFQDCVIPSTFGIIDSSATNTTIIGNTEVDCTYEYGARFRTGAVGAYIGNRFPNATVAETIGTWGAGQDLQVLNARKMGVLDTAGIPAYLTVDASNVMYLVGSSSANGPRSLISCTMTSDTSSLVLYPNVSCSAFLRKSVNTGLTATGTTRVDALLIAKSHNEFTTVAAGTGTILPANIAGADITIWNLGANTLNVYPVTGNQIDALGTNNPDTIAAGASKRYTAMTASQYRIAP